MSQQDDAEQLARRFGFVPGFDLARQLAAAAEQHHINSSLQWSTPCERKRAADATRLSLTKFMATLPELDRRGGGYLVPEDLRETLTDLAAAIQKAAEDTSSVRGGGPTPDYAGKFLVYNLHRAYRRGTGRTDLYTRSSDSGEYGGPFIEFATDALKILGVELSPGFIAEKLRDMPRLSG